MSTGNIKSRSLIGLLAIAVAGCSTHYYSDVPEPTPSKVTVVSKPPMVGAANYTVRPGDSLYKISFVTGQDWREIARLNNIKSPYVIHPGQVLTLKPSAQPAPKANSNPSATASKPPTVKAPPKTTEPPPTPIKAGAWVWPSKGALISRFSAGSKPHKGIDLAGSAGDPVYAANSGTVVYAGNGVRGYGNLLIVKHNATYLSAYAHNSRLLVGEGQAVTAGQKIAEFGDSGTDRVKLHFEIRQNGNPVDPLRVLPRR